MTSLSLSLRFKLTGLLWLGLCWPGGLMLADSAIAAPTPGRSQPDSMPMLVAQESITETVLYFETASMSVRIYRTGSDLFMNLYNKSTGIVEVNGVPAELVASTRDQTVYRNTMGEAQRFAKISVQGATELEIIGADNTVVLKEPGYNPQVGVPSGNTNFKGNNFAPGTSAVVISAEYANLRSQPRLDSTVLGSASRLELVDVLDRIGNPADGYIWYKVSYKGMTGWIRGDLLQAA